MTDCCLTSCTNVTYRDVLSADERLEASKMIQAKKSLRHPEIPGAVRGLEGMMIADNILKDHGANGILIGGLSEAVWYRKDTNLSAHKDVDVIVFDYVRLSPFQGGIDWWLPNDQRHMNGLGIALSFSVFRQEEMPSGLYIPDPSWVADMRMHEADGCDAAKKILRTNCMNRMRDELHEDVQSFRDRVIYRIKGYRAIEVVEAMEAR
jgi:hypothetical protein